MKQEYKISVIIPIYSVASYLPECVDSVLQQTYKNIEIILVDDGSPDESPVLCDQYEKRYEQVKVIHKENGGLSDARNEGIKAATGNYILFLDGDDYWDDENALLRIVERLNCTKADVLNFSYKKYYEDTGERVPYFNQLPAMPVELTSKKEQLDYIAEHRLYIASACNKLIKRSLFTEKLFFQKGIYSEDIEWCARLMLAAESMDFVCENFYCYRQRRDSITHTINDKKCQDLCNNIIKCIALIDKADSMNRNAIISYAAYQYGTFFKVQGQAVNKQDDCINQLEKYSWILEHHNRSKKLMILHIGCRLLGFRKICNIIRYVYDKKREKGNR